MQYVHQRMHLCPIGDSLPAGKIEFGFVMLSIDERQNPQMLAIQRSLYTMPRNPAVTEPFTQRIDNTIKIAQVPDASRVFPFGAAVVVATSRNANNMSQILLLNWSTEPKEFVITMGYRNVFNLHQQVAVKTV